MEVEIISSHCIKPSSPTPKHLQVHKLSLLDQFIPSVYVPMILFYTCDDHDTLPHRLLLLKQSLSGTLTRFYPLAGRIKDKLSIDCNDQGVSYTEAKANSSLLEFFNQPSLASLLHKFFPSQPSWHESGEGAQVAMIQVTTFACGGLAISAFVSHMIADGIATSFFLNSWGATARKAPHYASPSFDAPPAIFPQSDALPKDANFMALSGFFLKTGKITTRRLAFGPTAIAELRVRTSSSKVSKPTRVEAVSALIWKCITAALKANSTLVTHAVNMRRRADPTFPESYMGNFLWAALSSSRADEEKGNEVPNMVIKLREAITKINADFVKSLEGEGGCIRYGEVVKEMVEETSSFIASASSDSRGVGKYVGYTSWCKFGLYDVDFGWGKPSWVTCTGSNGADALFHNVVLLMDTPSGDGIEAWVYLEEQDMAILEQDRELLAFAALDPHPLELTTCVSHHA